MKTKKEEIIEKKLLNMLESVNEDGLRNCPLREESKKEFIAIWKEALSLAEKNKQDPTVYLFMSTDECPECKKSDKKLGIYCQYHHLIKLVEDRSKDKISNLEKYLEQANKDFISMKKSHDNLAKMCNQLQKEKEEIIEIAIKEPERIGYNVQADSTHKGELRIVAEKALSLAEKRHNELWGKYYSEDEITLQNQISNLEKEYNNLTKSFSMLESQHNEQKEQISNLEKENKKIIDENAELRLDIIHKEDCIIEPLNKEVDKLTQEKEEMIEKIEALRKEVTENPLDLPYTLKAIKEKLCKGA